MQTIRTNLYINASTQYTNFNFTSMCMFNGVVLGAGASGLFKLCCSDTDNAVAIDAYFIPYTVDFNDDHHKRLRRVYIGGNLDGDLKLTVTGNGNSVNGPYTITYNASETVQVKMFAIARSKGYKWVYADFKFENVNGSFFAIDSIRTLYSIHSRRRN
jgi:hypothetical protein